MSETPVPPPRGGGTAPRTGLGFWARFLRGEWGLLVLALALSAMVFSLVREDIDREHVFADVPVVADSGGEPDLRVLFAPGHGKVALSLLCSQTDMLRAERAVYGDEGRPVRLILGEVPPEGRAIGPRDRLEVPFPESYLKPQTMSSALVNLDGFAYRVARRTVRYALPPTRPDAAELLERHGVRCTLEWIDEPAVSVELPRSMDLGRDAGGAAADSIRPDPIDLRPYLAVPLIEDGKEFTVETPVAFRAWREQPVGPGERLWRQTMAFPDRRVKARFEVVASWRTEPLANAVVVLVKDADLYRIEVTEPDRIGMSAQFNRISGVIEAPRALHDELRQRGEQNLVSDALAGWVWGIEIVGGELPTSAGNEVRAKGRLRFLPLEPAYLDKSIRFVPRELQGEDFQVTIERKPD